MTAPQPPAVPDELVERAFQAAIKAGASPNDVTLYTALAAVADDLRAEGAAAERAQWERILGALGSQGEVK